MFEDYKRFREIMYESYSEKYERFIQSISFPEYDQNCTHSTLTTVIENDIPEFCDDSHNILEGDDENSSS